MRELVGGKNTIGRMAAVLKSPIKQPLPLPIIVSIIVGFFNDCINFFLG